MGACSWIVLDCTYLLKKQKQHNRTAKKGAVGHFVMWSECYRKYSHLIRMSFCLLCLLYKQVDTGVHLWLCSAAGNSLLPLFSVSISARLQLKSLSWWALFLNPAYGPIVRIHLKLVLSPWKNESRQCFPSCHISVALGGSAAESPQRRRCQSSNYKQQIYSGQSLKRGWSFVKAEQRRMLLRHRGVVSMLFMLDELLNQLCWNDYYLKNKQKKTRVKR